MEDSEVEYEEYKIKDSVLYEKARKAEEGDLQAQYDFASHVLRNEIIDGYDKGMIEKAIDCLRNVAINGACIGLGALALGNQYCYGKHVERDYRQAITWYRTALQANCIPAYYELGLCFYYGNGVDQDYAKAFDSFMKGSLGADMNQELLGDMYKNGDFVDRDEEFAYVLYKTTYDKILKSAGEYYSYLDSYGRLSLRLGECYLKGIGTHKNIEEANKYFEQAKIFKKESYSWANPECNDRETVRLMEHLNSTPYPIDAVTEIKKESNYLIDVCLVDLDNENIVDYSSEDYLREYFTSVKHMLLNKDSLLIFYKNMLFIYPQLPCFESDSLFIDRCKKKIKEFQEKEK